MARNRCRGSIAEFAPALFIFFMLIIVPIINLGFIPVRFGITSATVTDVVQRLSKAEKMSDAYSLLQSDSSWTKFLQNFGVTITHRQLSVIAYSVANHNQIAVNSVGALPSQWLPNGSSAPCIYSIEMATDAQIPPLWESKLTGLSVPGLTSALALKFHSRSNWENFGKDPDTQVYYVNE